MGRMITGRKKKVVEKPKVKVATKVTEKSKES